MANCIFISNFAYFDCKANGYEFQKSIQGFDLFEESKTFYSNGNLLLLPKIQRLYCMPYEE